MKRRSQRLAGREPGPLGTSCSPGRCIGHGKEPPRAGTRWLHISGRVALSALILVGTDLHVDFTFCSICTVSNNFWGILVKVKVAQSCLTLCDPRDYTVMDFSRPEYWSG